MVHGEPGLDPAGRGMRGHVDAPGRLGAPVADPAARDIEAPWPSGRFATRVRRTWNQVDGTAMAAAPDLDALVLLIRDRTGDDEAWIRARLDAFLAAERGERHDDPLLRPGAGLPSRDHAPT